MHTELLKIHTCRKCMFSHNPDSLLQRLGSYPFESMCLLTAVVCFASDWRICGWPHLTQGGKECSSQEFYSLWLKIFFSLSAQLQWGFSNSQSKCVLNPPKNWVEKLSHWQQNMWITQGKSEKHVQKSWDTGEFSFSSLPFQQLQIKCKWLFFSLKILCDIYWLQGSWRLTFSIYSAQHMEDKQWRSRTWCCRKTPCHFQLVPWINVNSLTSLPWLLMWLLTMWVPIHWKWDSAIRGGIFCSARMSHWARNKWMILP